jgi:hypothetical protein
MAISPNIYDRDKAAYKENTLDGGLDRRVTDVSTQEKLDDVISAINSSAGNSATDLTYNEVTSVASGVLTTVVTYTATAAQRLKFATASGTNIAAYELQINGNVVAKKYTNFGASLSVDFELNKNIVLNDVVRIRVLHSRGSPGDFNGTLVIES